jgi:hypothetical protein
MTNLILIWVAIATGLAWIVSQRPGSAGLPLAYFIGLSLIHVPGALTYLLADDIHSLYDWTKIGFEQTIFGLIAFLIGVTIARYAFFPGAVTQVRVPSPHDFTPLRVAALNRVAWLYLGIGFSMFAVPSFVADIPSATAVLSSLSGLLIVGVCLRLWIASKIRNSSQFWSTLAALPLLPLHSVLFGGFLGFGTYAAIPIVTFLFAQSKRTVVWFMLAPVVFYVGLSVFVNYMAARGDIRQLVWYENADLGTRLQRIADVFGNFEWLDLSNPRHREAIDMRLNQNWLVGATVARLESGTVEYLSGATFGNMIIALIPRVVWPNKPAVGGGGSVVRELTGLEFGENTSVGAGQVLEFYGNFGTLGVIGGFLLLGWLLSRMDLRIIESLNRGDQKRFVFWYLIALAVLHPGGNLIEIAASAAAAAVTAHYGLRPLLNRYEQTCKFPNVRRVTARS